MEPNLSEPVQDICSNNLRALGQMTVRRTRTVRHGTPDTKPPQHAELMGSCRSIAAVLSSNGQFPYSDAVGEQRNDGTILQGRCDLWQVRQEYVRDIARSDPGISRGFIEWKIDIRIK